MDEHGAPLRLRCGAPSWLLRLVVVLLVLLVTVQALVADLPPAHASVLVAVAVIAAVAWLRDLEAGERIGDLLIARDGRVTFRSARGYTWRGELLPGGWQCRWVSTLRLRLPQGSVHCLVLRAIQRPGEYRRWRVWLRHGLPEQGAPWT